MHRKNGTLIDVNLSLPSYRAIGKTKVTITQRFTDKSTSIKYDVDATRASSSGVCAKQTTIGKSITIVCSTRRIVWFLWVGKMCRSLREKLNNYPEGYKYLEAVQARLGHRFLTVLPTYMDDEAFWRKNEMMQKWLKNEDIDSNWDWCKY
ncbi:accessory factor associated with RNA polymerase II [Clarireedia jacksonii]